VDGASWAPHHLMGLEKNAANADVGGEISSPRRTNHDTLLEADSP